MKNYLIVGLLISFFASACYKTNPDVIQLLSDIKSQNEALKSQVNILQKSTDSLSIVLLKTNMTVNNIDKKVDSLKIQLGIVLKDIDTLTIELNKANANISDLQVKLTDLNKKCEDLFRLLNQYILSVNINNFTFVKVESSDAYTLINTNVPGQYLLITRTSILKSVDFGSNWTSTNWPVGVVRNETSTYPGGAWSNLNNGQFITGTLDNGFYTTSNLGNTFTQSGPTGFGCGSSSIIALADGSFLATMGGFQRGIYKSSGTNNQTWTKVWTHPGDATDFTYYKNKTFFACHAKAGCCNPDGGLLKTTDDGNTWTRLSSIPNNGIHDVEIIEDSLAWIDEKGNFYITNATNPNVNINPIYNLASNATIFAKGVYEIDMKYNNTKKLIAATSAKGLYVSIDLGKSWKSYTFNGANMYYNVTFIDDYLFVCTDIGVFKCKL